MNATDAELAEEARQWDAREMTPKGWQSVPPGSSADTFTAAIPAGLTARYKPLPDITAYELALLLPFALGATLTEKAWAELGVAARHLERI